MVCEPTLVGLLLPYMHTPINGRYTQRRAHMRACKHSTIHARTHTHKHNTTISCVGTVAHVWYGIRIARLFSALLAAKGPRSVCVCCLLARLRTQRLSVRLAGFGRSSLDLCGLNGLCKKWAVVCVRFFVRFTLARRKERVFVCAVFLEGSLHFVRKRSRVVVCVFVFAYIHALWRQTTVVHCAHIYCTRLVWLM